MLDPSLCFQNEWWGRQKQHRCAHEASFPMGSLPNAGATQFRNSGYGLCAKIPVQSPCSTLHVGLTSLDWGVRTIVRLHRRCRPLISSSLLLTIHLLLSLSSAFTYSCDGRLVASRSNGSVVTCHAPFISDRKLHRTRHRPSLSPSPKLPPRSATTPPTPHRLSTCPSGLEASLKPPQRQRAQAV